MAEYPGKTKEDITKFLEEIDKEMDTFKDAEISRNWDSIPDFYLGKGHWNKYRASHRASPVLNFLKQAIERKTALMTDSRPFIDLLPYNDSLQGVADALTEIIISKWSEQSLEMVLTDVIFYAELFGTCGTNTLYDPTLQFGRGDITFRCLDPRNINFDPTVSGTQYIQEAEYIRLDDVLPTSLLKQQYKNKNIKPNAPFSFIKERTAKGVRGRTIRKVIKKLTDKQSAIDRSIVREYWLKDRSMENGKALYPGGRHIIIAGEELVLDEKNPYWDRLYPIDLLDWHRNPDSAWGEGEIEDLRELQRLLNKLIAMIVENGLMMTNAIWIGDANALEPDEWDKIDNVPGLKIKKRPGTELRREIGAPLPTSLFSAVQYVEAAIEKLSGNTDVVAGRTPGEVKSGIAIEALQTAAMAIIRLKARAVEQLLSNIGQKMIARIFQFETEDRMMWRLTSEREFKAFKFFKKMLRDKELFPRGPQDAWRDFLFKVRPGSSLAMNKWQESLIAMQMYQAQPKPLIDRQGVLEKMDWEGRTELLARLEQQEAEELQQQIALMQMQQGGGQMPPSGRAGGSAPGVSDIRSPHGAQGVREAQQKGGAKI